MNAFVTGVCGRRLPDINSNINNCDNNGRYEKIFYTTVQNN